MTKPTAGTMEIVSLLPFSWKNPAGRQEQRRNSVIGRFCVVVPGELGEAGDYRLRGYKLIG